MQKRTYEEDLKDYLETLPIQTLRVLGRQQGVPSSSLSKKPLIIQSIVDLFCGRAEPTPKSGRGAPVKTSYLDPVILQKLYEIRRVHDEGYDKEPEVRYLEVASPHVEKTPPLKPIFAGTLEISEAGFGYLRMHNGKITKEEDIYVSAPLIQMLGLRQGDYVSCNVKDAVKDEPRTAERIFSVNEQLTGRYESRSCFDRLTPDYPRERIEFSKNNSELSLRIIDLFSPIGKGQRAIVTATPQTGSTTLIKQIACAALNYHRSDLKLIVILLDSRPEEVTEFRREIGGSVLFYATFEEDSEEQIRIAKLAIEQAKRYAERKSNALVLCDSVLKLARAYRNFAEENKIAGGNRYAIMQAKQFIGAARNTAESGSVTVITTASVNGGNRYDAAVFEEIRETCNAEIILSDQLAKQGVFPAIDFLRSNTKKDELLLSTEERTTAQKLREKFTSGKEFVKYLKKTKTNQDLIKTV